MQELVFALEYEPGHNPIADVLASAPSAEIHSRSCHVTDKSLWRVDHATGPSETLSDLESVVLSSEFYSDCLAREACGAPSQREVLYRSDDELVFYVYWGRTDICASIPHMALERFGEGFLFETRRAERRYVWRLIVPDDASASAFFERLRDEVDVFADIDLVRISPLTDAAGQPTFGNALPAEQREAMRAAVAEGYYETPREISLDDLADELDIPRSTLSYRLRSAESKLAKSAVQPVTRPPPSRL
ncbi:helix-turn-helix domain-containing protein [Haloplanus halobius]|uniref:helix-turn-helix domain-containing protein n=1 Tax=Haloplanus halobius TaxID=2934938 RepID=UPI00200FB1AA|nr:helix-turn-helix domain-containing protein [Haloplanus sp. XH21]